MADSKRKFQVPSCDESDNADLRGVSLFSKYKKKESAKIGVSGVEKHNSNLNTDISLQTHSTAKPTSIPPTTNTLLSTVQSENSKPVEETAENTSNSKLGKTFAQTFAYLKNTDLYKLPPKPVIDEKTFKRKSTNSIIVNPRQRGNPILKHVKNVPWEYGEIIPDYEIGERHCALFLSLRYHNLNSEYIHERLKALGNRYDLRVILAQVDIKNCKHSLKELGKIAILAGCTLILAWSAEEAGRYLETYKQYENKPPDVLQERVETDYFAKVQDVLTTIKSINKTDVITLLSTFGSLKKIINASKDEIILCPGFGEQKARRLHKVFNEPFKRGVSNVAPIEKEAMSTGEAGKLPPTCKLKRPNSENNTTPKSSSPHKNTNKDITTETSTLSSSKHSPLKNISPMKSIPVVSPTKSISMESANKEILEVIPVTESISVTPTKSISVSPLKSIYVGSPTKTISVDAPMESISGDEILLGTNIIEENLGIQKIHDNSPSKVSSQHSVNSPDFPQSPKKVCELKTANKSPEDLDRHKPSKKSPSLCKPSYNISKTEAVYKSGLSRHRKGDKGSSFSQPCGSKKTDSNKNNLDISLEYTKKSSKEKGNISEFKKKSSKEVKLSSSQVSHKSKERKSPCNSSKTTKTKPSNNLSKTITTKSPVTTITSNKSVLLQERLKLLSQSKKPIEPVDKGLWKENYNSQLTNDEFLDLLASDTDDSDDDNLY